MFVDMYGRLCGNLSWDIMLLMVVCYLLGYADTIYTNFWCDNLVVLVSG